MSLFSLTIWFDFVKVVICQGHINDYCWKKNPYFFVEKSAIVYSEITKCLFIFGHAQLLTYVVSLTKLSFLLQKSNFVSLFLLETTTQTGQR